MQVVVNQRFVNSRTRLGRMGSWVGLGSFIFGFALWLVNILLFNSQEIGLFQLSLLALLASIFISRIGNYNSRRFGGASKAYEVLAANLKGCDHRYRLLNYMPQLPVEHLLIAPSSLYVIQTKLQDGKIVVKGNKWQRKTGILGWFTARDEPLGDPARDTQRDVGLTREYLAKALSPDEVAEIPIEGVVVFLNRNAELELINPAVLTFRAKDFKSYLIRQQSKVRLPPEKLDRIAAAFGLGELPAVESSD